MFCCPRRADGGLVRPLGRDNCTQCAFASRALNCAASGLVLHLIWLCLFCSLVALDVVVVAVVVVVVVVPLGLPLQFRAIAGTLCKCANSARCKRALSQLAPTRLATTDHRFRTLSTRAHLPCETIGIGPRLTSTVTMSLSRHVATARGQCLRSVVCARAPLA